MRMLMNPVVMVVPLEKVIQATQEVMTLTGTECHTMVVLDINSAEIRNMKQGDLTLGVECMIQPRAFTKMYPIHQY
jgi:hypothetical protein